MWTCSRTVALPLKPLEASVEVQALPVLLWLAIWVNCKARMAGPRHLESEWELLPLTFQAQLDTESEIPTPLEPSGDQTYRRLVEMTSPAKHWQDSIKPFPVSADYLDKHRPTFLGCSPASFRATCSNSSRTAARNRPCLRACLAAADYKGLWWETPPCGISDSPPYRRNS